MYGNRAVAEQLMNSMKQVPGTADLRIQQPFNNPNLTVNVDRLWYIIEEVFSTIEGPQQDCMLGAAVHKAA